MLMALFLALLLTIFLGLALFGFWVWMLIDSITNKKITDTQRAIWALVIIMTGFIGAIIYFFVGRSPRMYSSPVFSAQAWPVQQSVEGQYPYQEGYRPREVPYSARQEAISRSVPPAENVPQQVEYEQMQISYPEEK